MHRVHSGFESEDERGILAAGRQREGSGAQRGVGDVGRATPIVVARER